MTRKTRLALRGVDAASDSSVEFRFAAGGEDYSWQFKAATFDELVALALGGRLGKGKDVHFDAAKVAFRKGTKRKPGEVVVTIGRKVRIVAPLPANDLEPAPRRKRGRAGAKSSEPVGS
jgi:hypothetical protein